MRRPDLTVATMDHNVPTENIHLPVADPISRKQMEVLAANCAEFGIRCLIELVPPHTLPRTSSGKLSRSVTRKEFLERHDEDTLRDASHRRFLVSDGGRRPVAA